jgi:magnesium transporter
MKFLASMAIILSIPNIIYGMYGMNIPLPLQDLPPFKGTPYAFYILNSFTLALLLILFFLFRKKKYL